MTRIGVRELRQNASVYLAQVKAGEVVEITERGTLIAVMRAPSPQAATREVLIAAAATLEPVGPRILDGLHLAGARSILSSLTAFVSYDGQLCDAAAAVGLPVVTPV